MSTAVPPPLKLGPQTVDDVAALLGVSVTYLKVVLKKAPRYTVFHIKKRKGGTRDIAAPTPPLRQLQAKLLPFFEGLYGQRSPVFGFAKGKSIKLNAARHAKSRFVLNLDLQDFFPSIHFGRVRGLLRGKPYFFGAEASRIISDICCRSGALPQGAPTSPILSNMVCGKMDSELKALAKKYHCEYTRYADDITFSTGMKNFPAQLAVVPSETNNLLQLGDELVTIIHGNGFQVNHTKVRLRTQHQRQEVTGLTVNKFPNVQRRMVRQVRAMLHAWGKFGLAMSEAEFQTKYDKKHRKKIPGFPGVLKAKIEFIGHIRGKSDPLYWRLLRRYASLDKDFELKEPPDFIEFDIAEIKKAVWVLVDRSSYGQSTAFMLRGFGLVTCDHGIEDEKELYASRSPDPLKTDYPVKVLARDQKLDLALLGPPLPKLKELSNDVGDVNIY